MTRPIAAAIVGGVVGFGAGVSVATAMAHHNGAVRLSSDYQLVLLDNGQTFFGRLEGYGSDTPVLRDVFYIQTQTDPDTKQPRNTLIKRGKEWHEPAEMVLAARHIVLIEPVNPASTVAKLIRESKR